MQQEESIYRISTKQLVSSLIAIISTLIIFIAGIGGYFISNIIDSGSIVRDNVDTIELEITALKSLAEDCEHEHFESKKTDNKRSDRTERRLDLYGESLAGIIKQQDLNDYWVKECVIRLQQ